MDKSNIEKTDLEESKKKIMKVLKIEVEGKRDNKDHPDISHIPNDRPLPSEYPEEDPNPILKDEPSEPEIPGPIQAPIKEPDRRSRIRVLNIEY